jgi:hypothetical protein
VLLKKTWRHPEKFFAKFFIPDKMTVIFAAYLEKEEALRYFCQ